MKVLRKIEIEVASDLKALNRVLLQFNQIYQDFIPYQDWLQCRLALAEGFTNAVRHAHKDLPTEIPIKIEVFLTNSTVEIRIWDRGAAFDLHKFIAETAKENESWLASGRGLPILIKVADRLNYYRTEQNQNCLLIVKELFK